MSDLTVNNRTTLVVSRLSTACLVFVLLLSLLQVGNYMTIRKARARLELQHEITDLAFRRLVAESVRSEVSNILSRVIVDGGGVPVSRSAATLKEPRFEVCSSLSTWSTLRNENRAVINGVECGVGDYCEYGLVVSIRRGRVICSAGDEMVVVAGASQGRLEAAVPRPQPTGEASAMDTPSW